MKILFLSDNFPPEVNAPATRTYEHCKEWVRLGHQVTVITSFPNFPQGRIFAGYRNTLYANELMDGIKVIRVWTFIASNMGFIRRTLDYVSFGISSLMAGLFVRCDVIIATSPQFFTAIGGRLLSFLKRKPWIMEVRDLWPASIVAVGAIENRRVIACLTKIESALYRSAARVIVVTQSFKDIIVDGGIDANKIHIVRNGVDALFQDKDLREVPGELAGIKHKSDYLVGYIGTHGMAHGLEFLIEAAKQSREGIHFVLVGDGADKSRLEGRVRNEGLSNIHFLPQVAKERIPAFLSNVDVAVIPLRNNGLFKTVIPSKIFETAAMQIPMLLGVDGEARDLVERYHAGLFFEPENCDDFLVKLSLLRENPDLYNELKTGCADLAKAFSRPKLSHEMLHVITELRHADGS